MPRRGMTTVKGITQCKMTNRLIILNLCAAIAALFLAACTPGESGGTSSQSQASTGDSSTGIVHIEYCNS